jgi:drug/metabolite transporter (DMT)-like permease
MRVAAASHEARDRSGRPVATAREHRAVEAGALLVMAIWAANFIVVKSANREIPPVAFALVRFSLAAGVLLLVLRLREGSIWLPRRDAAVVLALGALGFGVYQIAWSTALQWIPAGDSALLIAATPVMTAFLAVIAGSDVLTRVKIAGGLISFTGVAIVVVAGPGLTLGSGTSLVLVGDLLTLGATLCWSIYTAFGAPILRRHSPIKTSAWAMVGGCLVLLGPGLWQASSTTWSAVEPAAWVGLVYSSLLAASLANVLIFNAIRLLGPTRVAAFQFLVPFIAVLLGAAFLAESIRTEQVAGGIVIIVGVILTRTAACAPALTDWIRERLPS